MNIGALKAGNRDLVASDIASVAEAVHERKALLRVSLAQSDLWGPQSSAGRRRCSRRLLQGFGSVALRGVPENPSAWLMATAKNRALDLLRRERTARTYEPELSRLLQSEWTLASVVNEMFTDNAIKDEQLRMMFSCCDP